MIVTSFIAFLLAFTVVGLASARRARGTAEDYLVASRSVNPWLAALSSVATANSGFMFIGLMGFAYSSGVQAVWLQTGWLVGDGLLWIRAHRRARERSGRLGLNTASALAATDNEGKLSRPIAVVTAVATFFFLAGYAAAQLKAGSTALHSLFGWDLWIGSLIGVAVVVAYSIAGGIRASIWTDVTQAVVMLIAILALLGSAMTQVPLGELLSRLEAVDPALVDWTPAAFQAGPLMFFLGFVFAGLGTLGQPHVLVRTIAIDKPESISTAWKVYFGWFIPFSVAIVVAGLYARLLIPDLETLAAHQLASPAELALPEISKALLPDAMVGLMLAGLFAATMSTADSQLLACSAAITQDLAPRYSDSTVAAKAATLTVATLALLIALFASEGVFDLVLLAWSALGATLGPVLFLRVFAQPLSTATGLAMMAVGLAVVATWDLTGLGESVYKLFPGIVGPFVVYGLARAAGRH